MSCWLSTSIRIPARNSDWSSTIATVMAAPASATVAGFLQRHFRACCKTSRGNPACTRAGDGVGAAWVTAPASAIFVP